METKFSDNTKAEEKIDNLLKCKHRNPFRVQKDKERRERHQKKRARLIVRNISYKATEKDLEEYFQKYGQLDEVKLLKRPDGKLVGCAFIQYKTINQARQALHKTNNTELLGRPVFVDWAIAKDDYVTKNKSNIQNKSSENEIKKEEDNEDTDQIGNTDNVEIENANESKVENSASDNDNKEMNKQNEDVKFSPKAMKKEKHFYDDVSDGCTIFIKNVPFDATDNDLKEVCRKFGSIRYAIINRDPISGHSKGTAFVKFKIKESADVCLNAGSEFILMDEILQPKIALSRDAIRKQLKEKHINDHKDSRNIYLAREGLIMACSKAAEGVSASDMKKRHKLEQIKSEVLKNLNRFVSRNRLSIHNLPLNYDNDKLRNMVMAYTGYKPHECRIMRENKITAEHPNGKSKGFGFMSFSTHQEALAALRKLNNNPKIFGTQHRPIVAFSIEDRDVHKIKENRKERSKLNNPTFKKTIEKIKVDKNQTLPELKKYDKSVDSKHETNIRKTSKRKLEKHIDIPNESFVGTASKPGNVIQMRSNKKLLEQALEHRKNVKLDKKKIKQKRLKQIHSQHTRQPPHTISEIKKVEHDDLAPLVDKYKKLLNRHISTDKPNEPKRTKWYSE